MTSDLHEYKEIIEELKSVTALPEFDQAFKQATADIPKAKQFLIKMEMKRLSQPCNRVIDLRGNVDGSPHPYEHKGQVHYLDEMAKQIFETQVDKFGRYTMGVYEAVLEAENNNRVIHKREQAERLAQKDQPSETAPNGNVIEKQLFSGYGGEVIQFGKYSVRHEERMNFSINVELQFGIGNVLKASTSDLSISGAKVKIPSAKPVAIGQKVAMYLTGLEDEFALGLKDGIQYEIVGIEKASSSHNYIRMKRTYTEDITSFDNFLGNFINGNKRRYKVNLENTLDAVVIKGFEQFYLPRITSLPIFIRDVQSRLLPTLILATENNRDALRYFYDENQNLVFQQILSESRLMALAESELELKETLLFCFTHVKNQKRYFYSATREELAQSTELMQLFIGFGSHKPSWQVFKLQLSDSSEADAYQPLSIPDSASEEVRKSNRPPSPRVLAMLKDLKYIATLTPLSNATTATQYQKQYNYDRSKVSQLSQFGHPKLKRYISINVETVEYVNLRSEDRYLYKTKIELTKTDQNERFSGSTRDFSLHGLQVVADKPMPYKKGDILLLAMPDFQKLTKAMKLDALPYEVMAISKDRTIVNLRTFEPTGHHPGREFIGKVISQNRSKLTPAEMESRFPGLSKCLRNLAVRSAANLPLYFAKDGKRLRLTSVGQSNQKQFLLNLLRRHHPENSDVTLYPLIKGKAESAIYAPIMNKLRRTDRPKVLELYLHYRSDMMEEKHAFIAMFDHQIESADEVKDFVHSATSNDIFCAFRIYLSRTGRPDMSYVAKELAYVGSYAIHRAKELEEKLWNIIGLGDLVDISDELMVRHGISQEQIDRQHALKNQLLS